MKTTESKTQTVPVIVDNFIRAETDWAFDNAISTAGFLREALPLPRSDAPR